MLFALRTLCALSPPRRGEQRSTTPTTGSCGARLARERGLFFLRGARREEDKEEDKEEEEETSAIR